MSQNKKIIVGLFGGLDSVVLFDLLKELNQSCQLKLYVTYIHHGENLQKKIKSYRDKAGEFVSSLSQKNKIEVLSPRPTNKVLKSEEEFRKLRRSYFKKFLKQKKADLTKPSYI